MSSDSSDMSENNEDKLWIKFVVIPIGLSALFLFKIWMDKRCRKMIENRNGSRNDDGSNNDCHDRRLVEGLKKLSIADWEKLFSNVFEDNETQLRLSPENILEMKNKRSKSPESFVDLESQRVEDGIDNGCGSDQKDSSHESSLPSTILSLPEARDGCDSYNGNSETCNENPGIASEQTPASVGNGSNDNDFSCIICFENLQVGDTIVWSKKNGERNDGSSDRTNRDGVHGTQQHVTQQQCRHLFHKTCMVRYLASNAKRSVQKRRRDHDNSSDHQDNVISSSPPSSSSLCILDNPCPICRQRFCTIAEGDAKAVLQDDSQPPALDLDFSTDQESLPSTSSNTD